MSWKLNKKNLTHFAVSPFTATLHAAHRTAGKRLREKLGMTGNKFKAKLYGRGSITSAGSYAYSSGEYYGPTGSIVGRY